MTSWRPGAVLLPEGVRHGVTVTVSDEGTVLAVDDRGGVAVDGLLVPGLVNAHVHLELSHLRGRVPGGQGLPAWVSAQLALRTEPAGTAASSAVAELVRFGTGAVAEVTNGGAAVPYLEAAGVDGVIHAEVLGIDPAMAPAALAAAAAITSVLPVRPSPHAPYSTSERLLATAVRSGGPAAPPATIHLDEDPAERRFLATGDGPWAAFMDALGRDRSSFRAPATTPVDYLARLGLLGPRLALVHLTGARGADLDRVGRSGSPVVLCPRSALHIGGRLADVAGLLERGVVVAVGTDSLASCPDLDLLAELEVLARTHPTVPAERWLHAATAGGAAVLGRPDLGRIAVGARPGLLLLDAPDARSACVSGVQRRWLQRCLPARRPAPPEVCLASL